MKKNHILITNDDGIYAEGIQRLSQCLYEKRNDYRLSIVAPDRERSAIGHAITMHRPLLVDEINYFHNPELTGWCVNGTPSDCVKLAVEAILEDKPDLVISGITRGSNLGTDVLYSGTVSAAVEGLIMGIPSIAVSLTGNGEAKSFTFAGQFICRLFPLLLEAKLPTSTLININIPTDIDNINGIRATRLGNRRYRNAFEKRIDPRGRVYYWLAGELIDDNNEAEDADTRAIREGYISVTPIHFPLTNDNILPELKNILEQLDLKA